MAKISAMLPVHREVTREGDSKGRGRHRVTWLPTPMEGADMLSRLLEEKERSVG